MSVKLTTLENGMRVVTHRMDHLETVSIGVWAAVGARFESKELNGVSHFLEHMAFKGTKTRSAKDIAEEVEVRGGDLNAATSLETTGYYARVLKGDDECVLTILADILTDSVFSPEEMERERDVILQEIAAANDSPDDLVYDLIQEAAYPGQSIGRTILGTPETVGALKPSDLRAYLKRYYNGERLVVSAAGAVDHDDICRHVRSAFSNVAPLRDSENDTGFDYQNVLAEYHGGVRVSDRAFEQAHVIVGFEGPAYGTDEFFAAQVFSGLFGGGMSSRLFQEVREKRGLCYSIYSTAWGIKDTGMLVVHAATAPELLNELVSVMAGEFLLVAKDGVSEREVTKAKAQLKAGLLMGLESSFARAEQMARHVIAHGRLIDKDELIARVDAVDAAQIRELAGRMVKGEPSVAILGAGKECSDIGELARRKFISDGVA